MRDSANSALLLKRGQASILTIFGTGFSAGSMSLESKSSGLTVTNVSSGASYVRGTITATGGAGYGAYDLYIRNGSGDLEVATGAVEVIHDSPTIVGLDETTGSMVGGEVITITGTNFQDGSYVLFGGVEAASVTFVNGTTLRATTPAASTGLVDLAVHGPDGQQARLDDAFTFTGSPVFNDMLPTAAQISGGTRLYISGNNFSNQTEVLIDGTSASTTFMTSKVLQVITPAHAEGAVAMTLRNAGSPDTVVSDALTYVDNPDPRITTFTPNAGPKAGGTLVRIFGVSLDDIDVVKFGVDPVSGQGGKLATLVELIDSTKVEAMTSANPNVGNFGLMVRTTNGQGAIASGFTFEGSTIAASASGGGGGGCSGNLARSGPLDVRGELLGWALLFGGSWLLRRRLRRRPAAAKVHVRR